MPSHISPQDLALGEIANSPDFFKNLGQQFVEIASGNLQGDSAVVQAWQSQTALAQANRGAPLASLNTEQRARAQGRWLASDPGDVTAGNAGGLTAGSRQTVRPIVLDLDNNGISITTRTQGGSVLADVDDDGFAEETDWINPRDGILVIDKNGDGEISGGAEMFSDAQVNMAARGLNVLQALDADGDNRITAGDAAFKQRITTERCFVFPIHQPSPKVPGAKPFNGGLPRDRMRIFNTNCASPSYMPCLERFPA